MLAPSASAKPVDYPGPPIVTDRPINNGDFPLFTRGHATKIYVADEDQLPVRTAVNAFEDDIDKVAGVRPVSVTKPDLQGAQQIILVGTLGHSPLLDQLVEHHRVDPSAIRGRWESAIVTVVKEPVPGVRSALVIAGSDARGAVFALFDISRAIGVSPWNWWADVPIQRHESAAFTGNTYIQPPPAVQYRGFFINDEDWGMRPWASKKMDPDLKNIGRNTYARIFELLLRLHANTLWPAMHPGTLPFHAAPENMRLANQWGIVMGSSHSEALLRNNVGEWDVKKDGPWNYQTNRDAIDRYWDDGLKEYGAYENFYTVGMRGLHDSGLEATGSTQVKARLVEQVMADQRQMFTHRINPDLSKVPQVIWLYKESIDLYRAGMKVPDDVTLGWTDDNYGYIRQMPTAREQARSGGSALYYHVSYWGDPHDYLWLSSTPPALMREELTKAWDHGIRKLWILNVGDLKPAEQDIEYFLRMAWQGPAFRDVTQRDFLQGWLQEQFPKASAKQMADVMDQYYRLCFVRRPEFMGFNEYNDDIHRTEFNPLAWGDQNQQRLDAWQHLSDKAAKIGNEIPAEYRDAYFELVGYPVEAAGAHNQKLLWTDRSYLDQYRHDHSAVPRDADAAHEAYNRVQSLTAQYNSLAGGKWDGMMSADPRQRHVFEMPETAASSPETAGQLPDSWGAGTVSAVGPPDAEFGEYDGTVSIDATHFQSKRDTKDARWQVWPDLGLSNGSVGIANAGQATQAGWLQSGDLSIVMSADDTAALDYDFTTATTADATCHIYLLPTFAIDSDHRLRYGLSVDGERAIELDAAGAEGHVSGVSGWSSNVLRNALVQTVPLGRLPSGKHTLRLIYGDPGVVFEHISIVFPGAPPAYPFAPETRRGIPSQHPS